MTRTPSKQRTERDWARAALDFATERGLAAVGVEALSLRLGVTKGSFYAHFRRLDDLVRAAIELWEQDDLQRTLAPILSVASPAQRLSALLAAVSTGETGSAADLVMLANADHPSVRPTLRRVLDRRLNVLTDTYIAAGFPADAARRQARITSAAWLGLSALRRADLAGAEGRDGETDLGPRLVELFGVPEVDPLAARAERQSRMRLELT